MEYLQIDEDYGEASEEVIEESKVIEHPKMYPTIDLQIAPILTVNSSTPDENLIDENFEKKITETDSIRSAT